MDTILYIIGILLLLVVVWAVARFILKLTSCVISVVLTALIAIGILIFLFIFVF